VVTHFFGGVVRGEGGGKGKSRAMAEQRQGRRAAEVILPRWKQAVKKCLLPGELDGSAASQVDAPESGRT